MKNSCGADGRGLWKVGCYRSPGDVREAGGEEHVTSESDLVPVGHRKLNAVVNHTLVSWNVENERFKDYLLIIILEKKLPRGSKDPIADRK